MGHAHRGPRRFQAVAWLTMLCTGTAGFSSAWAEEQIPKTATEELARAFGTLPPCFNADSGAVQARIRLRLKADGTLAGPPKLMAVDPPRHSKERARAIWRCFSAQASFELPPQAIRYWEYVPFMDGDGQAP